MVLAALGDSAGAEREFRAAVVASPPLAQPRFNLAGLLAGWGEVDEARQLPG